MGIFPKGGARFCVPVFFSLFILMMLWGCYFEESQKTLSENICVSTSVQEAVEDKSLCFGSWDASNWWTLFGDEQLSCFVEELLENNPTLEVAKERVEAAQAIAKERFSSLLPKLDAGFNEAYYGFSWNSRGLDNDLSLLSDKVVPSWINFLGYMLNFRWALDIWGKNRALYRAAQDEMRMQAVESQHTRLMLASQLAATYFDLQSARNKKQLQMDILALEEEKLDILNQLYKNALCEEMSLQTLKKQILAQQNEILSTEKDIELCTHQMKTLMGLSPEAPLEIQMPHSSFGSSFPMPETVPLNYLLRRADIVSKIWKIQAQAKKIKSAKLAFLPSIDLASFSGYLNLKWDTLLTPRGWFSSILPGASLPIFKGLELKSKWRYSVKQYNLLISEYHQALLNAAKEVVDSISLFRISNQQLSLQEEVMEKQKNIMDLSEARYEFGLNSKLDVLNTKRVFLEDEMKITQLSKLHLLSALNLIKSIGGGFYDPQAEELAEKGI